MTAASGTRAGVPAGVSVALHVAVVTALAWGARAAPVVPSPPMYRVDLVAAPPGPRAIGQVRPSSAATPAARPPVAAAAPAATPAPAAPVPAPATAARSAPARPEPPRRTPSSGAAAPATPSPAAPAPAAGGGPTGGQGSDVVTVRTAGIDFPYPGYLSNVVRQIALRFSPRNPNAPLNAEVRFLIHRDGTVSDFAFVRRSGNYAFDLDAQGAVEAASGAFGRLPAGFADDVLPVVFSFDPSLLR